MNFSPIPIYSPEQLHAEALCIHGIIWIKSIAIMEYLAALFLPERLLLRTEKGLSWKCSCF